MKKRKPLWLKLIISLISAVLSIALVFAGIWAFIKIKYDINIINTFSQVKQLTKEVSPAERFDNMFKEEDMASAKTTINSVIPNLITYSENDGYEMSSSVSGEMAENLKLTDKQIGAVLNMLIKKQNNSFINVSGKELNFDLIQIKFSNMQEKSVEFNTVIKLDITSIKNSMNFFPANIIAKRIPNNIYISSTLIIHKGENPFDYSLESKSLSLNNLNEQNTASFLKTLNILVKFGNVEQLNNTIGGSFANAMIGNLETNGFAYSLKGLGAMDFEFEQETNKFVVVKK